MEQQAPFIGDGRRARPTHAKGDATTPVNGYVEVLDDGIQQAAEDFGFKGHD
jgi:hypothetical protein